MRDNLNTDFSIVYAAVQLILSNMNPCATALILASVSYCVLAGIHGGGGEEITYGGGFDGGHGGFDGGHGGFDGGHGGGFEKIAISAPIGGHGGFGGGFGHGKGFGHGIAFGGGGHGLHHSLVHGPVKVKGDIWSAKKYAHLAYGHGW